MTGIRLLIAGPDGAGKSSVAESVTTTLADAAMRVRREHFDPRPSTAQDITVPHPQDRRARAIAPSLTVILIRLLRYRLAALRRNGRLNLSGVDYLVQERGWLDQFVDPRRYRLHPRTRKFARFLAPAAIRYHGVIICFGDSAAIERRKPELSIDEIERQMAAWTQVAGRGKLPVLELNTTEQSIEESVAKAVIFARAVRSQHLVSQARPVLAQPRRLEMMATRHGRAGARALYRPLSRPGRARRFLQARIPGWGVTGGLADAVGRFLREFDVSFDGFAAIRSVGRDQGVIALVDAGRINSFVKIAWESTKLVDEINILRGLEHDLEIRAPKVLEVFDGSGFHAFRMSALTVSKDRKVSPRDGLEASVALGRASHGKGLSHGDLAPWNIIPGTRPGIIDWERASHEFVPGLDLAQFLVRARLDSLPTREYISLFAEYFDRVGNDVLDHAPIESCVTELLRTAKRNLA